MSVLGGGCHCGDVQVRYETRDPAARLALRACQCDFCRKHGARTTADPAGRLEIRAAAEANIVRYRFALCTADYVLCGRCGVYVAALLEAGGRSVATLNANLLDDPGLRDREATPVDYAGETASQRTARRLGRWTPAVLVLGDA